MLHCLFILSPCLYLRNNIEITTLLAARKRKVLDIERNWSCMLCVMCYFKFWVLIVESWVSLITTKKENLYTFIYIRGLQRSPTSGRRPGLQTRRVGIKGTIQANLRTEREDPQDALQESISSPTLTNLATTFPGDSLWNLNLTNPTSPGKADSNTHEVIPDSHSSCLLMKQY